VYPEKHEVMGYPPILAAPFDLTRRRGWTSGVIDPIKISARF